MATPQTLNVRLDESTPYVFDVSFTEDDPRWPPVSEFWFYYLDRDWRKGNCPHLDFEECGIGYKCHLNVSWGYSTNVSLQGRNQETVNFALQNYKEAAMDIVATFSRKD